MKHFLIEMESGLAVYDTAHEFRQDLSCVLEQQHYSGTPHEYKTYEWFRGKVTPLTIQFRNSFRTTDDYLDLNYVVLRPNGSHVMYFSITIDGSA